MRKQLYELALKIYRENSTTKTKASKQACSILGVEYTDVVRKNIGRYISLNLEKVDEGILNASESVDVNYENVPHLWLKTKGASLFVKNPWHGTKDIDFQSIIDSCMSEYQEVPQEDLRSQLRMLLKNDVKFNNFDNWIYSYEIIDCKFSTNIYEASKFKKDTKDLP